MILMVVMIVYEHYDDHHDIDCDVDDDESDQIGQSAPDWEHVHTTLLIDNDRNHSSCQTQPFPITKWEKMYEKIKTHWL